MALDFNSLASAEIVAACGTLGSYNRGNYVKDPDCIESLKDLVRFLKNDDESHTIRRQLAEIRVLQTDLLPLLRSYSNDKSIFDVTLRLLINLMNPALLLYHEELPEEKITRNFYLSIISHQQEYKQAFVDPDIWKALSDKLHNLMKLDWEHRQEEDRLTIERILILVRNILHVPVDSAAERRTDDDVSIHDQIIWAFHTSGLDDLIIYLATTNEEQQFCFHVLEILFLLLREQNPQQIAQAGKERCLTEKRKDELELMKIRKQELEIKKSKFHLQTSRHSRFGGTFILKDIKSISDRGIICHRKLKDIDNMSFCEEKEVKRKPKFRQPLAHSTINRRSTLSIRLFLQDFCAEFLKVAYNPFMNLIKDHLTGSPVQANDENYYLWAMQFFMQFNRRHYGCINLVTETMSLAAFHYIQIRLDSYYEIMLSDKKKISGWSKRMHVALKAYQELLLSLASMDSSQVHEIRETAKILKGNIFYVVEYREMLLQLLMNYDELKFSQVYIKDLVETLHIFIKMLQKYSKQHSHLIVELKKTRRKHKKKKSLKNQVTTEENNVDLEMQWNLLSGDLIETLQGNDSIDVDVVPFDATSDVGIDEQRANAVSKIKKSLQEKKIGESVSLLRAARDVWPENDVFGSCSITPENELLILKEIFFATVPAPEPAVSNEVTANTEMDDDETDEEEQNTVRTSEKEFGFVEFIQRFACKKIVQAYTKLLANYDKNSSYTNHCVLRMLHYIAVDCRMHGLLFQAAVFQTFQKILSSPTLSVEEKELSKLAKYVLAKFFLIADKSNKVFVELLFWKKPQEAIELEEGYEKRGNRRIKGPSDQCWTEEEIVELQTLYDEYNEKSGTIDKGVIDYITSHLTNQTKTRKQVIRQLKQQNLIESMKHLPNVKGNSRESIKKKVASESLEEKWCEQENLLDTEEVLKQGDSNKKVSRNKIKHNRDKLKSREQIQEPVSPTSSDADTSDNVEKLEAIQSAIQSVEESCITFFQEGLTWLMESIQETIDEEEDDDPESVPVVPIKSEHYILLEDKNFLKLMKALGFVSPDVEQETFWRFPAHLTFEQRKMRIDMLNTSLRKHRSPTENEDSVRILKLNQPENFKETGDILSEVEIELADNSNVAGEFDEVASSGDEQPRKRTKLRCIESDED